MMTRLALLSRLYFFDQVRVGTDAVYRDLRKYEADHSAPLRVLSAERREAFQQRRYRSE